MDARNALKSQAAVIRHLNHTNSYLRDRVNDLKTELHSVLCGKATAAEKSSAAIILSERGRYESALSDAAELRRKQHATILTLRHDLAHARRLKDQLMEDLMREKAGRADDVRSWKAMALAGLIGTACSALMYTCSAVGLL